MPSVQRARELFSSLRVRLVLWITLVVFLMVVVTYITVRAVEQQTLRAGYDEFLKNSLDEVNVLVVENYPENMSQLDTALKKKVKDNESRTWFLELYDEKKNRFWYSINAPNLEPPSSIFWLPQSASEPRGRL